MDVPTLLRTAETLLGQLAAAPDVREPWSVVLGALAAAAGLGADLVEHGLEPVSAITTLRSAVPSFAAGEARLREHLDQLAREHGSS
jgi:hypothetical protein